MASTAENLRSSLGVESPFGDKEPAAEEVVEEVVEDTEVVEEQDGSEASEEVEDSEESEDTEEDSEDEEKLSVVNSNLNRALKEERGLRQTAQGEVTELQKSLELSKQVADDAQAQLDSVVDQLKELDLEDLVKVEGKVDPKMRELMAEKEAADKQKANDESLAKFNAEMVSSVNTAVADYKNIDLNNDDQGIALQHMIYMASMSGMDMEAAVADSMKRLDNMLGANLKKRTPPVRAKKKLKSVSKTTASKEKAASPLERIRLAREAAEQR